MIVLVHKKPGPGYKWVQKLLFAPDGRTLITGGHIGNHIWYDLPATNHRHDFCDLGYMQRAQFSAKGELLQCGSAFKFTDVTTRVTRTVELDGSSVPAFDVTPNGRSIVFGATDRRSGKSWLRCAPLKNLSAAVWSRDVALPYGSALWCLDAKKYLLVTREDKANKRAMRYTVGSLKTGEPGEAVDNEWIGFKSVNSSDGRFFAVALASAQVAVFSTADFSQPLSLLKNTSRKQFNDIAFHPSGKYLAATSNDETVKLYDTNTWEVAHTFTWKIGRMHSVAFSPDGALAAAGSDKGQVVVWDVDL